EAGRMKTAPRDRVGADDFDSRTFGRGEREFMPAIAACLHLTLRGRHVEARREQECNLNLSGRFGSAQAVGEVEAVVGFRDLAAMDDPEALFIPLMGGGHGKRQTVRALVER